MKKNTDYRKKVLPVAEALYLPCQDLIVEEGTAFDLSASNEACSEAAHQIGISSFKDLQLLNIFPEKMSEEKVRQAFRQDDLEAMELAKQNFKILTSDCGCHATSRQNYSLNPVYNKIRHAYHHNLSQTLSDGLQTYLTTDNPYVKQAGKLYGKMLEVGTIEIALFLLKDIVVKSNGVLNVTPGAKILSANNIKIHNYGKIVINSSFIKINCSSLQGHL